MSVLCRQLVPLWRGQQGWSGQPNTPSVEGQCVCVCVCDWLLCVTNSSPWLTCKIYFKEVWSWSWLEQRWNNDSQRAAKMVVERLEAAVVLIWCFVNKVELNWTEKTNSKRSKSLLMPRYVSGWLPGAEAVVEDSSCLCACLSTFVFTSVYVYFCPTFPSLKLYSNPDQGLRRYSAKSSIISSLQKIAQTGSGSQTETQKHTQWTHTATQRPPHSHGRKINSYKHACIFFFFFTFTGRHTCKH